MIRSMTAFASGEANHPFGRLICELRSVNHRYLEQSIRTPEELRPLEPKIREFTSRQLSRGKVDISLRFHPSGEFAGGRMALNTELVDSLLSMHRQLAEQAGSDQQPNLLNLMRWPGAVDEQSGDLEPVHEAALGLLEKTLVGLRRSREREGEKISQMISERLQGVESWVAEVRSLLPELRQQSKAKLLDRIGQLSQPLDPGRLEQEVAFLAQKMDVDEELDRLDAHTAETRRVLGLSEPVGRRLDFLMQEFNRESNTLSSKSVDPRTTRAAVELKVLVEQMREQVQNVE